MKLKQYYWNDYTKLKRAHMEENISTQVITTS